MIFLLSVIIIMGNAQGRVKNTIGRMRNKKAKGEDNKRKYEVEPKSKSSKLRKSVKRDKNSGTRRKKFKRSASAPSIGKSKGESPEKTATLEDAIFRLGLAGATLALSSKENRNKIFNGLSENIMKNPNKFKNNMTNLMGKGSPSGKGRSVMEELKKQLLKSQFPERNSASTRTRRRNSSRTLKAPKLYEKQTKMRTKKRTKKRVMKTSDKLTDELMVQLKRLDKNLDKIHENEKNKLGAREETMNAWFNKVDKIIDEGP